MSIVSKTLFSRLQELNQGREQKDWVGIPCDELLSCMEQVARDIDNLNQRGMIHGDVKPHNVIIAGDSVNLCSCESAHSITGPRQSIMGTVAYAAPELFEDRPHIRSDQYCLGVSYVELRTGSLPFDEPNPYKVIEIHRSGRMNLRRVPRRERSVIKRATAIQPEKRWPSCSEMVRRLREACTGDSAKKRWWTLGR